MHPRSISALVFLLVAVGLALPAVARPELGTSVDATCTANGFVPAQPFNPSGADPTDPAQVDCALCHTDAQAPTNELNPAGEQFLASGHTDVSSFCSAPATNHPPHFIEVGSQDLIVGVPFVLNVTATDPDLDMMLLTVSNAPAGATFLDRGNGRGRFSWTPLPSDLGNHTVTFHVADTGTPMQVATLDVPMAVGSSVNHPPVLAPIGDQSVEVGAELALSLSASDEDGDLLTFEAVGMPNGASLSGSEFRFIPDAGQIGNHSVTFAVVDSGEPPTNDSETITITVGPVNRPPVLAPIGNRSTEVGTPMQIALAASDPDTDSLALACAGLPSGALLTDQHDGTGWIDWSPVAEGSALVTCTATDDGTPPLAVGEIFTLTATPAPPPDVPTPVIDQASWSEYGRILWVLGHWEGGTGDGAPVPIFGFARDGGDFALGTGMQFARDGRFGIAIWPFVAPCEIAAAVDGAPGDPFAVAGAPADCGETWLARAHARRDCRGELHVSGLRGPLGGEVVLVDATTGADLARVPVRDHWGGFSFEVDVGNAPRRLALRAELGGRTWQLEDPLPVWAPECRDRWHRHRH